VKSLKILLLVVFLARTGDNCGAADRQLKESSLADYDLAALRANILVNTSGPEGLGLLSPASSFVFSRNNRRLAYCVPHGTNWQMVIDGKPGAIYNQVIPIAGLFSPDSQHTAYIARAGAKHFVVQDGREHRQYEEIDPESVTFSGDSHHLAYAARRNSSSAAESGRQPRWFFVLDGEEQKSYSLVYQLASSPVGHRFAYTASDRANRSHVLFVAIDGERHKSYDHQSGKGTVFSPDGRRVAYIAGNYGQSKGAQQFVVVDGKEELSAQEFDANTLCFSPDSRSWACVGKKGKTDALFVDDRQQPAPGSPLRARPTFSPDSRRIAFLVKTGQDSMAVVVDGKPQRSYQRIDPGFGGLRRQEPGLVFSPDGKRIGYRASVDEMEFVVVDGEELRHYKIIREGPIFSSDGKSVAYVASKGNTTQEVLVLNEKEIAENEFISELLFTPGRDWLAATSRSLTPRRATVLLNGRPGKQYEAVRGLLFDDADNFHYFAGRAGMTFLVEETTK
jgi:Tol biopolymer transport system component